MQKIRESLSHASSEIEVNELKVIEERDEEEKYQRRINNWQQKTKLCKEVYKAIFDELERLESLDVKNIPTVENYIKRTEIVATWSD